MAGQLLKWLTSDKNGTDDFPCGNCNCSDCNGPSATADCFYDLHINLARKRGVSWCKPGMVARSITPSSIESRSRTNSLAEPRSRTNSNSMVKSIRSNSFSRPHAGSLSQFESEPEYYSAGGFQSEDAVGTLTIGTGQVTKIIESPITSKKKKKKKRTSSTSNDLQPKESVDELLASLEAEKKAHNVDVRRFQMQVDSLLRSLKQKSLEQEELTKKLEETTSYSDALVAKHNNQKIQQMLDQEFIQQHVALKENVKASSRAFDDFVSGQLFVKPFFQCDEEWPGSGSVFLFYLARGAHVVIPYLVNSLVNTGLASRMVLVGACAWNCYLSMPLDSEDIDFVVQGGSSDELKAAVEHAVNEAAKIPEVRLALDILDAVSKTTRRWSGASFGSESGSTHIDAVSDLILACKNATTQSDEYGSVDDERYKQSLRVVPNQHGWRIQLGHRALIDLCPAESSIDNLKIGRRAPLSKVLPTAIHWPYDCNDNPIVQVAHPQCLLNYMRISLDSGHHWRLQKDLPRLRTLAQEAFLQNAAGNPEPPFGDSNMLEEFHSLLEKYDVMGYGFIKQLMQQQAQLTQVTMIGKAKSGKKFENEGCEAIDAKPREIKELTKAEKKKERKLQEKQSKAQNLKYVK